SPARRPAENARKRDHSVALSRQRSAGCFRTKVKKYRCRAPRKTDPHEKAPDTLAGSDSGRPLPGYGWFPAGNTGTHSARHMLPGPHQKEKSDGKCPLSLHPANEIKWPP